MLDRGHEVRLVGTHLDRDIIEALRKNGVHPGLGIELLPGAEFFHHQELDTAIAGADLLVLGVSSAGVRWAAESMADHVRPGLPVLAITKGIEWDDGGFVIMPDLLRAGLPEPVRASIPMAAVTGPCIAGELARRAETCVVFAGEDAPTLEWLAGLLRTEYYHVRCSTDLVGSEMSAGLKNGYALAIGFAKGVHEARGGRPGSVAMHNYEAAVFSQAVLEMRQLVRIAGGADETVIGLVGSGDLMVTTNGGRTGRFGRWLGLGLPFDEAVEKMDGATLECLSVIAVLGRAIEALEADGRLVPTDLPLMRHLREVVTEGVPVAMPFEAFF
jgi:glycerol-3-phosphate dehydrogenase (NAD(P)+)